MKNPDKLTLIPCPNGKCGEHYAELCQAHKVLRGPDGGKGLRQCHCYPLRGARVCGCHGGRAGRPVTTGAGTQIAKFLGGVPQGMRDGYLRRLRDPGLLALDDTLALAYERLEQVLRSLDAHAETASWAHARNLMERALLANDTGDKEQAVRLMNALRAHLQTGHDQRAAWAEIATLMEQVRRLTETEVRRRLASENVLTVQQARAFVLMAIDVANRQIRSDADRRGFFREMTVLMRVGNRPAALPPQGGDEGQNS